MNTAEFALSQLKEDKLCATSETHVDIIILIVRVVCVCFQLFGMHESSHAIHKIGLYTLSLQYEREYS